MAVVLIEGFDHYDSGFGHPWLAAKGWNGTPAGGFTGRLPGSHAIDVVVNNPVYKQLGTDESTLIVGAAIKITEWAGIFLAVEHSGATVARLGANSDGHLFLVDAAAREVDGTSIIPTNSWFYVEMEIVVGTSGTYEVRLNGDPTPEISGTGNFGTDWINRIVFECQGIGQDTYVDDVYADTTDFLGDVAVRTLSPVSDGTYSQWTADPAGSHYADVDELMIDGDASFIYDSTPGDKDSFNISPLPVSTVYGAQLNLGARKGDAGSTRQIAPIIRQSGTDYVGSTFTLSAAYLFYSWLLSQDPSGSDWTGATINADEYGVELIA